MKPSYIVIAIAGLIIAACIHKPNGQTGPWKLLFKDPTRLKDPAAFEAALNNASDRWEKGVTIRDNAHPHPTPRPHFTDGHGPNEPTSVSSTEIYPSHNQPPNPDSLHVTQKVVLYQAKDYADVLKTIQYPNGSSK